MPAWTDAAWNPLSDPRWPIRWGGSEKARAEGRADRILVAPDLFNPRCAFGEAAAAFGVMAQAPRDVFQVRTSYPERALEWFQELTFRARISQSSELQHCLWHATSGGIRMAHRMDVEWPLRNVWLGSSDAAHAAALQRCPAAVHFVLDGGGSKLEKLTVASMEVPA